jgi:hypothetical protein
MKFVSIWEIEQLCHHNYPESTPTEPGQTLFVHPNQLHEFAEKVLPTLTVPFVLVTGCSDYTIPFHFKKATTLIFKSPVVLKWFAQNCAMKLGKLEHLPIGMDYHQRSVQEVDDIFEGLSVLSSDQPSQEYSAEEQEKDIEALTQVEIKPICYGNFHFSTSTTYGNDREEAVLKIPKECIEYEEERLPRQKVFEKMSQYKYVVSPFGNGLDCHRTWEALAVGCIPIIRSSGLDPLFEGLPVMIVNDWSEITRERLDTFVPDKSKIEKCTVGYWIKELYSFLHKQDA